MQLVVETRGKKFWLLFIFVSWKQGYRFVSWINDSLKHWNFCMFIEIISTSKLGKFNSSRDHVILGSQEETSR